MISHGDGGYREPPKVFSSDYGNCYFKMMPINHDPEREAYEPYGIAYKLDFETGAPIEQWAVTGWYAHQVYLHDNCRSLVRMGVKVLNMGDLNDTLALAFYLDGNEIASYSIFDLIEDPQGLTQDSITYRWEIRDRDYPRMYSDYYELKTREGIVYAFSLRTGEIIEKKPN